MSSLFYTISCIILTFHLSHSFDLKGFDDTILYNLNWPGDKTENIDLDSPEFMIVKTSHQEEYKCLLPSISEKETKNLDKYEGPTPLELVQPLFSQTSCSYRLESYWTYEVCHGRFIRQFHEDREGKKVKIQEYYLGRWTQEQQDVLAASLKTSTEIKTGTKKIDGLNLPYFEILMGNGTLCDLNQNKPRQTKLVYVCYLHGKHEIYSLKETSTCQYEIIVLSPFLCAHPKYKSAESTENQINCIPLDKSPTKPYNMLKMQVESAKMRRRPELDQIRVEFIPMELQESKDDLKITAESPLDSSPVESFLAGKNCLNGGTGWWKYEFCYGKSVEQYHIERDGSKTSINLGRFNLAKHLSWLEANPHKRPKLQPSAANPTTKALTKLSHFYADGSVCDKTGRPRQTEVKLKCLENTAGNAVSLYLLEPRYCEYILGVESPLICEILNRVDENGLVQIEAEGESPVEEESLVQE